MAYSIKSLIPSLLLAGIILLAGCSGSPANSALPPAQAPATGAADNLTAVAIHPQSPLPNRIDVIYFHVNQRCPTCLCFEERVNHVIETDFSDAISSGRLTYKVLNAQQEQNAGIARQYGAVASQLFINTVVNGKDNIKDIQDIWNWNCRGDAPIFDRKVRSVIDDSLKGLP